MTLSLSVVAEGLQIICPVAVVLDVALPSNDNDATTFLDT